MALELPHFHSISPRGQARFSGAQEAAEKEAFVSEPVKQRLFSLQETAVILGRSVNAVRSLVRDGHFPSLRMRPRGKLWIPREAIDDFIRGNTLERTPPRASGAAMERGGRTRAAAR